MAAKSVDRWFGKFLASGDPRAFGRFFDLVAPELGRVAASLSGPGADPRDLVQQALLIVLQRASDFDRTRPVLPWVCGILANLAHEERRRRRREPSTETLVERIEQGPDPATTTDLGEVRQRIVETLATVPPPQRAVVELYLLHGLSPIEIARVLDRNRATVRSQLARGLEMLRRSLPTSLAPALVVATVDAKALASIRTALLSRLPAAPAWPAASFLLGLLMHKSTLVVAGLALLTSLTLLASGAANAPSEAHTTATSGAAEASRAAAVRNRAAAAHTDSRRQVARESSARPIDDGRGGLRVSVRFATDGAAARDIGVWLQPASPAPADSAWALYAPRAAARTDAAGIAVFRELEPGAVRVVIDRCAGTEVQIAAGIEANVALQIQTGLQVSGRVVDEADAPVAGAAVERWVPALPQGMVLARTDAEGRFAVRDLLPSSYLVARAEGHCSPGRVQLPGASGTEHEVTLVLERGRQLRGTVRTPWGEPAAQALVAVASARPGVVRTTGEGYGIYRLGPSVTSTDENGRFRFGSLPSGRLNLRVRARNPEWGIAALELPPAADAVTVDLPRAACVFGVVHDEHGAPVRGARVTAGPEGYVAGFGYTPFTHVECTTDATGAYELPGLGPGSARVYARPASDSERVEAVVELMASVRRRWDPVLAGRGLSVHVRDDRGRPLAGWVVRLGPAGHVNGSRRRTDDEGRAFFESGRREASSVSIYHPGQAEYGIPFPTAVREVAARAFEVYVDLAADQLAPSGFAFAVRDDHGGPAAGCEYVMRGPGCGFGRTGVADAAGSIRCDGLPPGEYRIALQPRSFALRRLPPFTLGRGQRLELPAVDLATGSHIDLRAFWPPDVSSEDLVLELLGPDGVRCLGAVDRVGRFTSPLLPPGAWRLAVHGPGIRRTTQEFALGAGRGVEVVVEAPAARTTTIELRAAPGAAERWFRGRIRFTTPDGRTALDARLASELASGEPLRLRRGLEAGNYLALVTDDQGRQWRRTVTVESGRPVAIVLAEVRR